jgi:hypothetical protein
MVHRRFLAAEDIARWALTGTGLGAMLLILTGCSFSPRMGMISTAADGRGFVEKTSGKPFVPFGVNYYDPNTGWPPHVWSRFDPNMVTIHFKIMGRFGINCARVSLTAAFTPDVNTVDEAALQKLDELVAIARRSRIRLIVTAPTDWEGQPDYWKPDRFTSETALKASQNLWTVIGQRYRDEPVILAWDLANEPQMPWHLDSWDALWNAWLQAKYSDREGLKTAWADELAESEQFGDIAVPKNEAVAGNPRLNDWQLFREHLADEWVEKQAQTLRTADPTHLITIGYVQWSYPIVRPGDPNVYPAFNPRRQAQWLDFISMHFYPLMGEPFVSKLYWDQNIAYLQSILAYCQVGKPVILGEYGWYGGGMPKGRPLRTESEQERWLMAEVEASRRLAQGWLSWPFADTPEATDMAVFGGMVRTNMIPKRWGARAGAYASNGPAVPQPAPPLPSFDFAKSLTTPVDDLVTMQEEYEKQVQAALEKAGPMPKVSDPKRK